MTLHRCALLLLVLCVGLEANAQLDTRHWVPPFFAKPGIGTGSSNIRDHFVALSTPSEQTIPVTIRNGFGQLIDIVEISRDNPVEYMLGTGNANTGVFPLNVVPSDSLNIPIKSQGLVFTSFQPFFVNMRHKSGSQGTSLTTKGRAALGKKFFSGHLYTIYNNDNIWNLQRRAHFISVMATEDNTTVTFDMIKLPIALIGHGPGEPVTVTLNALESYVVGVDHQFYDNETINNTNGIRITSDKNIVCNTGSWLAGNQSGQDIGSDQIVPADNVGQEYIVMRGLGNATTERPMVVATTDNTQVFLNDETEPAAELDEGEFYFVPTDKFTDNGNLYVQTTERAFMYQTLSGSASQVGPTVGLNFIPPLNCVGAKVVNIPFINSLAAGDGQGRINILAKLGGSIFVNGSTTPLEDALPVVGRDDWVTYAFDPPTNNVLIETDSVMNVALLTRDILVGTAGYFSGFTLEPVVGISSNASGSLPCAPGNATFTVSGFDTYQWFFNGEAIAGATQSTLVPQFSGEYVVEAFDLACGFQFRSNPFEIPLCPSTIGAAKNPELVEETALGSRIFDVTYRIFVENFLNVPAVNVQVMENIQSGLPVGATVELLEGPSLPLGVLTGGTNPDFNGTSDRRLLPGDGTMPPLSTAAIDFQVRVNMNAAVQDGFLNQVIVTTTEEGPNDGTTGPFNGQDFSHQGTNPDPNGNGEPNEEGENDPTVVCFFSNAIVYDEAGFCATQVDAVEVTLDGIFSGVFASSPAGLSINSATGTVLPNESAPGTYTITYTTNGRCPKVTETQIAIIGLPDTGGEPLAGELCAGGPSVNLDDFLSGADLGGTWTNEEGDPVPSQFTPEVPGVFTLIYVLDVPPCEPQSLEVIVEVFPIPDAGNPVDDLSFCISQGSVNLSDFLVGADAGGIWTDADGNTVSEDFGFNVPGVFAFTYSVSHPQCGTASSAVELNIAELADAGTSLGSSAFCIGETIDLDEFIVGGTAGGTWFDGQGQAIDPFPLVLNVSGVFEFQYVVNSDPCPADTATVQIDATLGPNSGTVVNPVNVCISDPPVNLFALLDDAEPGGTWTDENGNVVPSIFIPEIFGSITRRYTLSSAECGAVSTTVILVVTQSECLDPVLIIPQGFSPNGDGIADLWVVQGLENYPNNAVKIFNRWGVEVFSSRPYNSDWDGKAQSGVNAGAALPTGTYWYILELGNGSEPRKGYVFLNR